jgi:hypothetical protein
VPVKTPGRYGGRFVIGQTGNPRTFNAMMAQPKVETAEEARIDALMDEIVSVQDPVARTRAYKEVETIVNEQA